MTIIAENGKGPAGSQACDLAVPEGALTLLRVLEWPPTAETAGTRVRVSPARACRADQPRCQVLLEIVINMLQTLLASTGGHPERLREIKLSQMKGGWIRLAGERYGLTAREKQVLAEIVEGKSNRQIATALTVSVSTAKSHVSNILSKMGVESRTAAVTLALRQQSRARCGQKESGAGSRAGSHCPLSP